MAAVKWGHVLRTGVKPFLFFSLTTFTFSSTQKTKQIVVTGGFFLIVFEPAHDDGCNAHHVLRRMKITRCNENGPGSEKREREKKIPTGREGRGHVDVGHWVGIFFFSFSLLGFGNTNDRLC